MANPFKEAEKKDKKAPGGIVANDPVPVVNEPDDEPAADTFQIPLVNMVEQKPEGKSCSFYLSVEATDKLEKLAKKNKTSKSKVLDAMLRSLPL